jgi:hypothetical protein
MDHMVTELSSSTSTQALIHMVISLGFHNRGEFLTSYVTLNFSTMFLWLVASKGGEMIN